MFACAAFEKECDNDYEQGWHLGPGGVRSSTLPSRACVIDLGEVTALSVNYGKLPILAVGCRGPFNLLVMFFLTRVGCN
jgi:hypothetical protein